MQYFTDNRLYYFTLSLIFLLSSCVGNSQDFNYVPFTLDYTLDDWTIDIDNEGYIIKVQDYKVGMLVHDISTDTYDVYLLSDNRDGYVLSELYMVRSKSRDRFILKRKFDNSTIYEYIEEHEDYYVLDESNL